MIDVDMVEAAVKYCKNKVRDLGDENKMETLEMIVTELKAEINTIEMQVWQAGEE